MKLSNTYFEDNIWFYVHPTGNLSYTTQTDYEVLGKVVGVGNVNFPDDCLIGFYFEEEDLGEPLAKGKHLNNYINQPFEAKNYLYWGEWGSLSKNITGINYVREINLETLISGVDNKQLKLDFKPKKPTGAFCNWCTEYYPYAESNQTDGSMKCWSCRNTFVMKKMIK